MGRVQGKVALITGGASGLGAADAVILAREGAKVFITDVQAELGRTVSAGIPDAVFIEHDVRDEDRWQAIYAQIWEQHGRLDILVNNAGLTGPGDIENCSLENYRFVNAIMSEGTFLGCKYGIPFMARSGGGSIINIASLAAVKGIGAIAAYCAAKGAVVSLTRSAADHCLQKGYKIRCNAILPGGIDTPLMQASLAALPVGEPYSDMVRDEGYGDPDDVANLVLYLASDEAKRVTGASLLVDNGESIR